MYVIKRSNGQHVHFDPYHETYYAGEKALGACLFESDQIESFFDSFGDIFSESEWAPQNLKSASQVKVISLPCTTAKDRMATEKVVYGETHQRK